jgi:elongation factor 2
MDDKNAVAIRDCDPSPDAPLMMYISKMVPSADRGRFFAFGRVFSGTIKAGMKVRIQGPDYIPGTKLTPRAIQRTVLMMGGKTEPLDDCPAGNLCGLVGVDQFILKSATLSTDEAAHNLRVMKFSVSPVVNVAVLPVNAQDIPKLVEGLKRLSKTEPGIIVKTSESGEHIISGAGELQLEIALKDLEEDHAGVPIKKSNPIVECTPLLHVADLDRETVQQGSSQVALAKSPNKHNRIYMTAQPLEEQLVEDIESGKFDTRQEFKQRGRVLADNYGWDVNQARKIFAFGPSDYDANIIVDSTVGIDTREIKDSVVTAFTQYDPTQRRINCRTSSAGPLAGEQLRGVRLQIPDVKLHSDAIHRGMGQLFDPLRRSICGSILYAKPALVEPFYLVDIQVHESAAGAVYSILTKKRGVVTNEEQRPGTPLKMLQAFLPVNESFGFNEDLRGATHGQAFPQMVFHHWEIMAGNPFDVNERSGKAIHDIRVRKGMQPNVQPAEYYVDKL